MFQLTSVGYKYASVLTNMRQESWLGKLPYSCSSSNIGKTWYSMQHNRRVLEELFPHESGSDNYWSHIFMDSESVMNEIRQMIAYIVCYW
mgnify:CR=1 FL=1